MKTMLKLSVLVTLLFLLSCSNIIGSSNVFELDNLSLTITEKEVSNSSWKISGTVVNIGDTTVLAPWYIEAMFYSDSTFTETFGGDNDRMNFHLESGVTRNWTLTHRKNGLAESDYPNFAIKDLRAYIQK